MQSSSLTTTGTGLALGLMLCLPGTDALAQSRRVIVNAERLNDAQVARLERANCRGIPDGAYWLNTQTGAWGYAGSAQVQGHFGDACRSGGNGGNASSAEGRYGPYATLRRAQEVANQYSAQGYRAVAFHSGDGYYVDVKR